MACYAMIITSISPMILDISRTYQVDLATVGVLFTFLFIGLTVFVPVAGNLADRVGKKRVLNVSVIGLVLALFGFVKAPSFVVLCILSIFIGGFGGVTESMIGAFVHDINPEKPEYYVNMTQVFFGIGAIIGPLIAGQMLSKGFDWRIGYTVIGLFMAAAALVFLFSKGDGKKVSLDASEKGELRLSELIKSKVFILLCLAMFFYTGSEVGAWGWMCTYLEESFMFTADQSSVAVAFFWLALTLGRIFCGWLTTRFSTVGIVSFLAFSSAAFTLFSALVKSDAGIYGAVIAMGLAFSSQYPLILSYAGKVTGRSSGKVFSILTAFSGIGNMIVPFFMGVLGDFLGMQYAMILPALLFLLTGAIFVYFGKAPKNEFN